jgi:hypothetical protein
MAIEDDKIDATDDPKLAEKNGFTHWDEGRGQWVAPPVERKDGPEARDDELEPESEEVYPVASDGNDLIVPEGQE